MNTVNGELYFSLKNTFDNCMYKFRSRLASNDATSVAKILMEITNCKIYPPIIPASWVGFGSYRRSVAVAKEASVITVRMSDTLREMWLFHNNLKLIIPVKYFDPSIGVIIDEGVLRCPTHSLVNAFFFENPYPLWDFQIRDICVPMKGVG